jgi:Sec-independent protein secretion pathway component TatC
MQVLLKILSVMGLSFVMLAKAGVPAALAFGFDFFKSVTVTSIGGILGGVFFVYMWDRVITTFKKRRFNKQKSQPTKPKKKFTIKNKMLIKLKKQLGLVGITFVTPLLSYPLGCFVAVKYFQKEKQKIITYLMVSTLMWSVLLCSIKLLL